MTPGERDHAYMQSLILYNKFLLDAVEIFQGLKAAVGIGSLVKNGLTKAPSLVSSSNAAKTGANLTKSQLKSISSFESQIAKHQAKLAEYTKNPMKFDNKGLLKNAPNDVVRQKII